MNNAELRQKDSVQREHPSLGHSCAALRLHVFNIVRSPLLVLASNLDIPLSRYLCYPTLTYREYVSRALQRHRPKARSPLGGLVPGYISCLTRHLWATYSLFRRLQCQRIAPFSRLEFAVDYSLKNNGNLCYRTLPDPRYFFIAEPGFPFGNPAIPEAKTAG